MAVKQTSIAGPKCPLSYEVPFFLSALCLSASQVAMTLDPSGVTVEI